MATWAFRAPSLFNIPCTVVAQPNADKLQRAYHRLNLPHSERTLPLEVLGFRSTSSTSFRITFSRGVIDNELLRWPVAYQIRDTRGELLPVYSVTPEAVPSPTYVDLVTREQLNLEPYTLRILEVESAT